MKDGVYMELIINKKIYDNKAPYEKRKDIGKTYRLLNKHLTELGYGSFNCNDLFEFWNEMSENRSDCWLDVPENIEDFKDMIGYYEENEENEGWEMR